MGDARLEARQRELLNEARRGVLATIAPDGRPRLVPCAFAFSENPRGLTIYSALDEKPKSLADPRDLARVRDIVARPNVGLLVDRWSEDWTELAWLRLDGTGTLLEPSETAGSEHALAIGLLRGRYPQYATHHLESRPMLRIAVQAIREWTAQDR